MSPTDVTLNGVSLDTALSGYAFTTDINRPLGGEVRSELVEVPGRDGAWMFPEEPGEIIITIGVHIYAASAAARRDAVADLRGWAQTPDGRVPLIIADEDDRFWEAMLVSAPPMVDEIIDGQTTLVFSCHPYAYATTGSTEEVEATTNPDSGSFATALSYDADPVIEITPQGGTLSGFFLEVNDSTIQWYGPLIGDGETITVSSISQTVTLGANDDMELTGVFNPDDVSMADVSTNGFPELVNGSNPWMLAWNGTATSVDVVFTWRERFI